MTNRTCDTTRNRRGRKRGETTISRRMGQLSPGHLRLLAAILEVSEEDLVLSLGSPMGEVPAIASVRK